MNSVHSGATRGVAPSFAPSAYFAPLLPPLTWLQLIKIVDRLLSNFVNEEKNDNIFLVFDLKKVRFA